jgi:hypothetical protein
MASRPVVTVELARSELVVFDIESLVRRTLLSDPAYITALVCPLDASVFLGCDHGFFCRLTTRFPPRSTATAPQLLMSKARGGSAASSVFGVS